MKKYKLEKHGLEVFRGFTLRDKIKIKNYFEKKLFKSFGIKRKYNISSYHKWFKKEKINHEKLMSATNRHFYPPNHIKNIFFSKKKIFFEIVLADGYDFKALKELKKKKNLRIIDSRSFKIKEFSNFTNHFNNLLTQSTDLKPFNLDNFKISFPDAPP